MPYNPNNFIGLYQEGGLDGVDYKRLLEVLEYDVGTTPCLHAPNPPFHFTEWTADCKVPAFWDITQVPDLMAADGVITLAERALMLPTPAYAQVSVTVTIDTHGAPTPSCPPYESGVACNPNEDAFLGFEVTDGFGAEFPWETGVFTEQLRFLDGGSTDAGNGNLRGFLERPPDGDSYTGDPTNDASSTLIPWDQFIADPSLSVRAYIDTESNGVNSFGFVPDDTLNYITVRLFYPYNSPVGTGLISFIGGA